MPFAALIGVELLEASPDLVRGRLSWKPECCTIGGVLHGGALVALADSCGGACAFLNLPEGAHGTATVDSTTNLLHAVREGAVIASARPLHIGRLIAVIETEIRGKYGWLTAKTTQTQVFHYPS